MSRDLFRKVLLNQLGAKSQRQLRWFSSSSVENSFKKNGEEIDRLSGVSDAGGGGNLFSMYRHPDTGLVNVGQILTVIERTGVRRTDSRLKQLMDNLEEYKKEHGDENARIDSLNVPVETFQSLADPNIILVTQTMKNKMVIPEFPAFCQRIKDMFLKCEDNTGGKVATYIPQLARSDPSLWGLSICTVDGQRYSLGDVDALFTLQSCSKPFTYAICLKELGSEVVHKYIGQEPSGRNFNEICLDKSGKPHNPMLNAGAIMSCSLMLQLVEPHSSLADMYDFLLQYIQRIAGDESIGFNNSVFLSERDSADRNFSMGYFMKENQCFPPDVNLKDVLDLYFQSCSLEVNTETVAVMGATLANGGICPTTGQKVLEPHDVRDTLSLMYSCGMYNYSGEFAFTVGLPAKSGVSGSILLVVPNVMCIALYSPPLDSIGNSVRGQQFCKELVDLFNFHRFDNLRHSDKKKLDPRRESFEVQGLTVVTLLFAAVAGDVTALHRHYLQGLDMSLCDYDGRTALHLAAAEGQLPCVEFLVQTCGVAVAPVDRWGHTPLAEAEREGHSQVAEFLRSAMDPTTKGVEN